MGMMDHGIWEAVRNTLPLKFQGEEGVALASPKGMIHHVCIGYFILLPEQYYTSYVLHGQMFCPE